MKTVIFVWDPNPYNVRDKEGWDNPNGSYWGIGDIIRGAIYTYKLCQTYNYNFFIDLQKHPISKFLKINKHEHNNYVKDNRVKFVYEETPEEYINKTNSEIILIMHNRNCKKYNPPDNLLKYFIDIFTPNNEYQLYVNKLKDKYNIKEKYNIFHFRLGGCEKTEKLTYINDKIINRALDVFNKNKDENDIIISDTKIFKTRLLEKYDNIKIIDEDEICHFGNNFEENAIKNSLFEFLLLVNSSFIKTFTKYKWISGFAEKAAILKNIQIKHFTL